MSIEILLITIRTIKRKILIVFYDTITDMLSNKI